VASEAVERYRHSRGLKPHPQHKWMVPDVVAMVAVEDVRAASDHVHENPPARCGVEYEAGWQDACEAIDRRLGLNTDNGRTTDGD
jgi:hypothetical protein